MRYFPGKDIAWLRARLDEVLEDEASGTVAASVSAGDVNTTANVQLSIGERKRRLLHDLAQLDPEGGWQDSIPARVTRAVFKDA